MATVPRREWDAIAALGFDAVWFMGVWERSPAGIAIANQNKGLLEDFRRALRFPAEDNVGRLTVCATTWSMNTWAVPKGLPMRGRELGQAGIG